MQHTPRAISELLGFYTDRFFLGLRNIKPTNKSATIDEDLRGQLNSIIESLWTAARTDKPEAFYKRCQSRGKASRSLFDRIRSISLCWDFKPVFYARNRRNPKIVAIYVVNRWSPERNPKVLLADRTQRDRYLRATGRDEAFLEQKIAFGCFQMFYLRWGENSKAWQLDSSVRDKDLESVLYDEIFYPEVRETIWSEALLEKEGMQLDDLPRRKDIARFYRPNRYFSKEKAIYLELTVDKIRQHKSTVQKHQWTPAQRLMMGQWKRNPHTVEWITQCLKTDEWRKFINDETLRGLLASANAINTQEIEMMVTSGKDRLLRSVEEFGVEIFRKPIMVDLAQFAKPSEQHRGDPLELLIMEERFSYWGRRTEAWRKESNEIRREAGLEPIKFWSVVQERGLSLFQVQGYQTIRFNDNTYLRFFGIQANPKIPFAGMPLPRQGITMVKGKDDKWLSGYDRENNPHRVEMFLVSVLFRSALKYALVTDSEFGNKGLGKGRFFEYKFTGKEFNDRLKKVKLYDILRIRKADECIPYKKGMDFKKLPVFTLEEIRKSE